MKSLYARVMAAVIIGGLAPLAAKAQRTVIGATGVEMRYLGDTIWRTRDTTMTRMVLRGDTAQRTMYVHGKVRSVQTWLQRGDTALILSMGDSTGAVRVPPAAQQGVPALILSSETSQLENALRSQSMQARVPTMNSWEAPLRSDTPRTYPRSANSSIEQHKDTVRYIRGCLAAPPMDTTTYLLFGVDSARRVSPNPRMFDRHMARAIQADMSSTILRSRVAQNADAPSPPIPALRKWPCDKR